MSTQRGKVLYAVVSVVLSLALSAGFVVYYVTQSNQKLCNVLEISTQPRPKPPEYPIYSDGPESSFGQKLEKYNKDLDVYNKELETFNLEAGRRLRSLMKDYHCSVGDL